MERPDLRFPKLVYYSHQATMTASALAKTKQNSLRDVFEVIPALFLNK